MRPIGLFAHARKPVMKLQRILFPTDFSEISARIEAFACGLADQFDAELHVLHVLPDLILNLPRAAASLLVPPRIVADIVTSAEEEIQKIPPATWSSGKQVVRVVRVGPVYDTIARYARENGIDLIVIGTHGRTGMSHALLGSVAERVVQLAPCSVLTVRPAELPKVAE